MAAIESSPIDVLVPGRLPGFSRPEPFVIRDGIAKLRDVYGGSASAVQGWLSFDAYGASRARMDPTWPNRLAGADIAVSALVGDAPSDAQVDALLAPDVRDRVDAALARVPTDWALHDALPPDAWDRLLALYAAVEVPGVDLRRMTRILCVKRPRLVPCLTGPFRVPKGRGLAEAALEATQQAREVMARNRLAIMEISTATNAWLEKASPPSRRARLTPARTFSELLTFELGGYRRFAGWQEHGGGVRRARSMVRSPRA